MEMDKPATTDYRNGITEKVNSTQMNDYTVNSEYQRQTKFY